MEAVDEEILVLLDEGEFIMYGLMLHMLKGWKGNMQVLLMIVKEEEYKD